MIHRKSPSARDSSFRFTAIGKAASVKGQQSIASSKGWETGIPNERMKPFERIQLVKAQSGKSSSGEAGR